MDLTCHHFRTTNITRLEFVISTLPCVRFGIQLDLFFSSGKSKIRVQKNIKNSLKVQ